MPGSNSHKIKPSKKGLWIISLTKEVMELAGVSWWQGGISGAFHVSIQTGSQTLKEHSSSRSQHPTQHHLETAVGTKDWAHAVPRQLDQVQSELYKNVGLWFWQLCTDKCCEKGKSMCVFETYGERICLKRHWQHLFFPNKLQGRLVYETLTRNSMCKVDFTPQESLTSERNQVEVSSTSETKEMFSYWCGPSSQILFFIPHGGSQRQAPLEPLTTPVEQWPR